MKLLQTLSKWLHLPLARHLFLAEALLTLLQVRWRLRVLKQCPLPDTDRQDDNEQAAKLNCTLLHDLSWATKSAAWRMRPKALCLEQSLAIKQMLARRGVVVAIKIGVTRTASDNLGAHAWLEYQNQVIFNQVDNLDKFTVLK